jgi:hypothetical protein
MSRIVEGSETKQPARKGANSGTVPLRKKAEALPLAGICFPKWPFWRGKSADAAQNPLALEQRSSIP